MKSQGNLSPADMVAGCLDAIGPLDVGEATYGELLAQAQEGGEFRWNTDEDATKSEQRIGILLALIAASRDYQFA